MNPGNVSRRRLCFQQSPPACVLTDDCVTVLSDSQGCKLFHSHCIGKFIGNKEDIAFSFS